MIDAETQQKVGQLARRGTATLAGVKIVNNKEAVVPINYPNWHYCLLKPAGRGSTTDVRFG